LSFCVAWVIRRQPTKLRGCPIRFPLDQFWELADKCGITGDELNSRMGGGP